MPAAGTYIVKHGKTFTVEAFPKDGYEFSHFILAIPNTPDIVLYNNPLTVKVEGDDWIIETWFKPVALQELIVDVYTERGGKEEGGGSDTWGPGEEVKAYTFVGTETDPYENWPVTFYLAMPNGTIYKSVTSSTNNQGIASWQFYLPYYCYDPERAFGIWNISATSEFPAGSKSDFCSLRFSYLANITKVAAISRIWGNPGKTFKLKYDEIDVKVELLCSMVNQPLPVLLVVVVYDDLGVLVWYKFQYTTLAQGITAFIVPGTYYNYTGIYNLHVIVFDKDPCEGGSPYCPEIIIQFQIAEANLQYLATTDYLGNAKKVFGTHELVYLCLNVSFVATNSVPLVLVPIVFNWQTGECYWDIKDICLTPGENILKVPTTFFNTTGEWEIFLDLGDGVFGYDTSVIFWLFDYGCKFTEFFGDINFDQKVDMRDVAKVSKAFGSNYINATGTWDPQADITGEIPFTSDCKVDMRDVSLVVKDFGKC